MRSLNFDVLKVQDIVDMVDKRAIPSAKLSI
jgi:hypothetical protein